MLVVQNLIRLFIIALEARQDAVSYLRRVATGFRDEMINREVVLVHHPFAIRARRAFSALEQAALHNFIFFAHPTLPAQRGGGRIHR